ncbi:hypothetical protein FOC4_g10001867 [Fusarium odoratissimum]|uniref:HTH CENPB-type domain-containing protein n=2 Tax=Fusarium oxysporum species complex TaxID=171631 RepID=N1S2C4_FUSC4|nr:hypothetical protein FOC4_g10001867 [Fusarium odoratissimum]TXB98072.1 hypothetical protein FocTR4_00016950 [Fusarium oxysporum f. sp. cubense]
MSCDREYRAFSAMEELKTQPLQPTAKKYAISRGSLRNRQKGGTNARDAQIERQKLSEDQEEFLIEWILNEEAAARAPTKKNIRLFGNLILKYDNQDQQLGNHWVNRFLTRHPDIKTKLSRSVDAVRTRETTEEPLERFYKLLARQMEEKNVGAGSLHNIDEHGVAEGETKKGKVIGSSYTPYSVISKSDSRTWVSIIECISAAGRWIKPTVIFTGENLQGQWFDDPPYPDWSFVCTETGWSNSHIFYLWFRDNFLPETAVEPGQWRILILDGHKSHITVEIMYLAWINKVQLLYLPPHSSHATQPLDVGIFGILKRFFHEETEQYATFEARSPIQKRWFIRAYEIARLKALTSINIRHAFRGAGIYPVDINKPLKKVVKPSCPPLPKALPKTPKKRKSPTDQLYLTPKNYRDVRARLFLAEKEEGTVSRGVRRLLLQTGHQLSRVNTINAGKSQEITHLQLREEARKPTGRKAVNYDPNEQFARIPEIASAHFQAENADSVACARLQPQLQRNSIAVAESGMEKLLYNFQFIPN